MDLRKAFDSVEHSLIDAVLDEAFYGIPPVLADAVKATYKNRSIQMKLAQGISDPVPLNRGVPQGDHLSPLLFLLAINPLLDRLETRPGARTNEINIPAVAFCDDLSIVANSKEHLDQLWETLCNFCLDTGLEINTKKTEYSTNSSGEPISPSFNNDHITITPSTSSIRSLGTQISLDGCLLYTSRCV